jgi:hypothetical protein
MWLNPYNSSPAMRQPQKQSPILPTPEVVRVSINLLKRKSETIRKTMALSKHKTTDNGPPQPALELNSNSNN